MSAMKDNHKHDDIIHLPHPVSCKHPRMSVHDRAAQFSAFAALTGFDGVISETARLTDGCIELDEGGMWILNEKLQTIADSIEHHPVITLVFFQPDEKKAGGTYIRITDAVKRIDLNHQTLVMMKGDVIPISRIYQISGDLFF